MEVIWAAQKNEAGREKVQAYQISRFVFELVSYPVFFCQIVHNFEIIVINEIESIYILLSHAL